MTSSAEVDCREIISGGHNIFNSYPLSPIVVVKELHNHIAQHIGAKVISNDEAQNIICKLASNKVLIGGANIILGIMIEVNIHGNPKGIMLPYGIDAIEYETKYSCKISDVLQPIIESLRGNGSEVKYVANWEDFKPISGVMFKETC